MNIKNYISIISLCFTINLTNAQNLGVSATGATPNNASIIDLNTGNTFTSPNGKGLLPPNVALTGRLDIITVTAPPASLLVYNTATANSGSLSVTPGFYYWDGTIWVAFAGAGSKNWALLGNAGTVAGTNFLGTTDAVDLVLKTNNTERVRVLSSGNVGIGTTAPTASLHITAGTLNTGFRFVDGTQGNGKVLTSDASGNASWKNTGLGAPSGSTQWDAATTANTPYANNTINTSGPFTVPTTGWYTMQSRWFVAQNMASSADQGIAYCWIQIDNVGSNTMDNLFVPHFEIRMAVNSSGQCPPSGSFVYLVVGTNYYVHQFTNHCQTSGTGERKFIWQFVQ